MQPITLSSWSIKGIRWAQRRRAVLLLVTLALTLLGWELLVRLSWYPPFILPPPGMVAERLVQSLADGSLLRHSLVTLSEVLTGLLIGTVAASSLGYTLARWPVVERLVSPFIIASQSVPVVAIAPLLVIWFGSGTFSKVLICTLTVFFPILINTIIGLRSVPKDLRDLMRTFHATGWQTFRLLEVPAAMPVFLGGLRIGATLAVIGAVVGEFVGADRGLGFLINRARGQYDTALVFVAILALVVIALCLYGAVIFLEMRLLAWQEKPEE